MAAISKRVRAALYGRLSARFNSTLAAICTRDSLTAFSIDFASWPKSVNFFTGQLDPAEIEESTPLKYPLVTLYTAGSVSQCLQKPATFAGLVTAGIDVHLSWRGGNVSMDMEAMGDAVEETMVSIMNDLTQQSWGANVIYDGKIRLQRGAQHFGAENWRQLLRFSLNWEVVA